MQIVDFSVKNSQFTFIVFLGVMALGLNSLLNMPRSEDPRFAPPGFSIVIPYPGAGPAEVEEKITNTVEERLAALENVDRLNSSSFDGVSLVVLEFKHGSDPDKKYDEVIREMNALRAELPDETGAVTVKRFSASDVAILQAAILSENASWDDLRCEAERLENLLERIPGIKGADTWGYPLKEVHIALKLPQMNALGIPVSRVLQAINGENVSIPGGVVHAGERMFFVQTSGDYDNIEQVRNTLIWTAGGQLVYLRDLADVAYAYAEPGHLARLNGVRAVWVTARMQDGQNIAEVGRRVKERVAQFRASLPASMAIKEVFDQSDSVRKRLSRFIKDFGIAIFLVLLTLLPLGWRASLVVMISIPLSIAIGVFALDQLGYSLNQLSIVGLIIALGILVDDSIVVVENIERWLREGHSRREAAILATRQIALAVIGCTATLILAFLPLVFLPEASGDFIRSLPLAVVTTVLASLFVSLTIVPFLSSRMLSSKHHPEGNLFLRGMKWGIAKTYAPLLHRALKHPWRTLLAAALIFGGSLALAPRAGFALFPASERPMFYIDVDMAPGASFEQTDAMTRKVEQVLRAFAAPGFASKHLYGEEAGAPAYKSLDPAARDSLRLITWYASNVGRGNPRVYYNVIREIENPGYAQIFVQICPGTPPEAKVRLIERLRDQLGETPGASINVKNFEQGPPVEAPIAIRVIGENLDTLRVLSEQVERLIQAQPGVIYVNNPISRIKTDLHVRVNKEKAAMLGIPAIECDRMVRLTVAGLDAGAYTDAAQNQEYNLNVTTPRERTFADIETIKDLYVSGPTGQAVPLNQIAELQFKPAPDVITHFKRERYASVSAYVRSGYFPAAINQSLYESLAQLSRPAGYRFVVAGEAESAERSFSGIGAIVLAAIFGLLAVLVLEFKTFRSTLVVLSVIPLGIIGAVLILLITGYPFSFTVVVGLIALMGIEIKNSILLVDFTNALREQGLHLDDAIQQAGEIRFVPILLTSLTAIGGLTPLAIEENPLYSPLAYVLIGGLISSTLLSRIVTPVLYKLLAPRVAIDN
ncbi:MAG: efflux RND transporter permease subunit [Saprospiraceae bacterium]